jgi:hypothetical protein
MMQNPVVHRDGISYLFLGKNNVATMIDTEDYNAVKDMCWSVHSSGYAAAKANTVLMHRVLVEGEVVHHINGNRMDNRRANLEGMTREEHQRLHATHKPAKPLTSSGHRCIYKHPWGYAVRVSKKYVGSSPTLEGAISLRDAFKEVKSNVIQ